VSSNDELYPPLGGKRSCCGVFGLVDWDLFRMQSLVSRTHESLCNLSVPSVEGDLSALLET